MPTGVLIFFAVATFVVAVLHWWLRRYFVASVIAAAASPLIFALVCLIHGDEMGMPPPKVLGFFAVLSFIIAVVVGVVFLAQRRWFAMAPNNRWRGP
jgi:hypothetical protein